jgi:hypothetical protein
VVDPAVAYRKAELIGRSAACYGDVTESEEIHSDRAAEVSSGHSTHASEAGPNSERE